MNDRILKVKTKLIELGYIDNEWLTKYLEVLEANLDTPRNRKSTQAHHAIPVNSYWTSDEPYDRKEALKLSRLDINNFEVNLLYGDHLLIHSYLTLCTDLVEVQRRYEAQAALRKVNSAKAVAAKPNELIVRMPKYITEEKILAKLSEYEAALEKAKKDADEKADHKYRTLVAQWRSKYRQYLAAPEKYNTKKNLNTRSTNTACHQNAIKREALRQNIAELHENYINLCANFSSIYYAKKDVAVQEARLLWKRAINDYKIFIKQIKERT